MAADCYIDNTGTVKEIIIREATEADLQFLRKQQAALSETGATSIFDLRKTK